MEYIIGYSLDILMIGIFPEFTRLEISHKDEVEAITNQFDPYSDFNFTSLFCWNVDDSTKIATLNDNLIIKFPHYTTGRESVSVIGENNVDDTLKQLLKTYDCLGPVPEIVLSSTESSLDYLVEDARGDYDYIYSLASLASITGADYKKKRNKINRFKAKFGDKISVVTSHDVVVPHLEQAFVKWASQHGKMDKDTKMEYEALRKLLAHAHSLDVLVTTVFIDKELCGFSINEELAGGYAICHFEKATYPDPDTPTFLTYAVANELLERGCKKVNWEQDLDIPGLRQSKLSYKPIQFLKKYTLHS